MRIEKFNIETDLSAAIEIAESIWGSECYGTSDLFTYKYFHYLVGSNYINPDLAIKIMDGETMLGVLFAGKKYEKGDKSYLSEDVKLFTQEERDIILSLDAYMTDMDERTVAEMNEDDVKVSFYMSIRKGCGKALMQHAMKLFKEMGLKEAYLWTDTTCDHSYYAAHGFVKVAESKSEVYSTEESDYISYIYKRKVD